MTHMPDDFGWSDLAKRQERERLGYQQPMFGHRSDGWPKAWLWAAMGIVLGGVVAWLGVLR